MDDPDRTEGLYNKFTVLRVDGSSMHGGKHNGCVYFVLDWKHDKFAVVAARAYASACEAEYPLLAEGLRQEANYYEKKCWLRNALESDPTKAKNGSEAKLEVPNRVPKKVSLAEALRHMLSHLKQEQAEEESVLLRAQIREELLSDMVRKLDLLLLRWEAKGEE